MIKDFYYETGIGRTHRREASRAQNAAYKARSQKLRASILNYFGPECKHCGYKNPEALQIDHVFSGGNKERKVIGFWTERYLTHVWKNRASGKYQILCANCNWIKRMDVLRAEQAEAERIELEVAATARKLKQKLIKKKVLV